MNSVETMEAHAFVNEDGSKEFSFTFYTKSGNCIGNLFVKNGEAKRFSFSDKKAEMLEKRIAELLEILSR